MQVKAKKKLGQHFLEDEGIAQKIVNSLSPDNYEVVLEIGPGMGVLTKYLARESYTTYAIDVDKESVAYLKKTAILPLDQILLGDFLKINLDDLIKKPFAIIGNFPYNISSQIVFKTIENRHKIPELVGMFQKEVAERICAKPGSKIYGITSVLTQAFFNTTYLFSVPPQVFRPPPKVNSGVIKLTRIKPLVAKECERLFFTIVKTAFNQRRKKISNSLSRYNLPKELLEDSIFAKRPEQLSVCDFVNLMSKVGPYVD
jgi:16S rRNA (adenine1518-N6/adenine1519-N6)-dimethyltransferase